jgi:tRNA(fMet)-specific endonuclease VapC
MIEYLLDTNVISDLVRDPFGALAARIEQDGDKAAISLIAIAEIQFGLRKNPMLRRSRLMLNSLERFPALAWEAPAELRYAELRVELERLGTPIGSNDMLIAAHALALDCTLVTANEREFRRVPGLRVENWRS